MEILKDFIVEDALVMIPVLYFIGMLLKSTPKVPSYTIPYVLLFVGVPLTVFLLGFSAQSFVQGFLVSGAAVYLNNLIKQGKQAANEIEQGKQ